MIKNYKAGQQDDPLNKEHKELILSWESLTY